MNIFQRNARKFVIVATISGAASVIFIRLITTSAIAMGFYRLGFSVLIFSIPIIFGGYKGFAVLTIKDYLRCGLTGLLLFCHFVCWFTAVKNTAIASASVLASLHPIVILFISIFILKQNVHIKAIIGILVALTGGAIIAGFDYNLAADHIFGDIMAFASAICFGVYFVLGRGMRTKIPAINYIFLVFSACWVFFTIAMFVTKTSFTGYSAENYLWLFMMSIVCQVIAHALYNWCMGYASSLYVSVWVSSDAIFATTFGAIFFAEMPTSWQYIGGAIAISGLLYYNYNEEKTRKEGIKRNAHDV